MSLDECRMEGLSATGIAERLKIYCEDLQTLARKTRDFNTSSANTILVTCRTLAFAIEDLKRLPGVREIDRTVVQ